MRCDDCTLYISNGGPCKAYNYNINCMYYKQHPDGNKYYDSLVITGIPMGINIVPNEEIEVCFKKIDFIVKILKIKSVIWNTKIVNTINVEVNFSYFYKYKISFNKPKLKVIRGITNDAK